MKITSYMLDETASKIVHRDKRMWSIEEMEVRH